MADKFEAWGVVEIMGHQSVAGRLSEQVVAGANLLRVDVPQNIQGEGEFRTEYLGPQSIYRMRVTTEHVARAVALRSSSDPAYAFGLRLQAPALTEQSTQSSSSHSSGDDLDTEF